MLPASLIMTALPPKPFRTGRFRCLVVLLMLNGCGKSPAPDNRVPNPAGAEAATRAAASALDKKHYDKALTLIAGALKARPNDSNELNLKGAILTKTKDYEGAQACYEEALRISPDFFPARYNIGALLSLRQQWNPAIAYFRNLLMDQPNNELVQYKLLLLLLKTDSDPKLQEKLFASGTPSNSPAWYYATAARALKKGKPSEAEEYLRVAKSVFGDQTAIFQEELEESDFNNPARKQVP